MEDLSDNEGHRGLVQSLRANVKVTIGDVELDQHFFVQDLASHPVTLGQLYITSSRMETKVFDNGEAFALSCLRLRIVA